MAISTKEYSNGEITILWRSGLCTQSAKCVNGLPEVFNINSSPWINPKNGNSQDIIEQVSKCPSGALSIKKEDADGSDEANNNIAKAEVLITKNGPIMVSGEFELVDSNGETIKKKGKTFLCRCGNSASKPFCDSSHKRVNFVE